MEENQFITKKYLDEKLKEQSQMLVGAIDDVISRRLENTQENLRGDINNVQILIDGYVKAQEEFKQEFVIMREEIRQIKDVLHKKLNVEIRAF